MEDSGGFSAESPAVKPAAPDLPPGTPALRDEDRLLVIFSYLGPLCFVSLITRQDPFVHWHARQGTALFLAAALLMAALSPFHWLFSLIPLVGRFFRAMELFLGLGYLAIIALAIDRALCGQKYRVPWIADLADRE